MYASLHGVFDSSGYGFRSAKFENRRTEWSSLVAIVRLVTAIRKNEVVRRRNMMDELQLRPIKASALRRLSCDPTIRLTRGSELGQDWWGVTSLH